jgi:AraC-like DNA-binding protein
MTPDRVLLFSYLLLLLVNLVLVLTTAALVALVLVRKRATCPVCGAAYRKRIFDRQGEDVCPTCRKPLIPPELPKAVGILGGVSLLVALGAVTLAVGVGLPHPWVLPLGLGTAALVLVMALIVGFARLGQPPLAGILRLGRQLLRFWIRFDLRAARRAARTRGEIVQASGLTVWMEAGDRELVSQVQTSAEKTARAFERLTGQTLSAEGPCRVLCFETEAACLRYLHPASREFGRHAGSYTAPSRIVLCREVADAVPGWFERTVVDEFAHHFMSAGKATFGAAWWQEGLATLVASEALAPIRSAGAELRILRAAAARQALFEPQELITMSYVELVRQTPDWRDARAWFRRAIFYDQSTAVVGRLAYSQPGAFTEFVGRIKDLRRVGDLEAAFRACFGCSPPEAAEAWRTQMLSEPVPPPGPVPQWLQQRFDAEWCLCALDMRAVEEQRRTAIRLIGLVGYPQWLEPVRQVAERPDDPMRADATIARDILTAGGETNHDDTTITT